MIFFGIFYIQTTGRILKYQYCYCLINRRNLCASQVLLYLTHHEIVISWKWSWLGVLILLAWPAEWPWDSQERHLNWWWAFYIPRKISILLGKGGRERGNCSEALGDSQARNVVLSLHQDRGTLLSDIMDPEQHIELRMVAHTLNPSAWEPGSGSHHSPKAS